MGWKSGILKKQKQNNLGHKDRGLAERKSD